MNSLKGIKVVDFTRALSGPFCTMILGDLGADVIKVEQGPAGDMSREWGPFDRGISTYYLSCNRNKRGLGVDLRNREAVGLLRRLIGEADVIVENFRPGTMAKMGLDFGELSAEFPRLVTASITAYGERGPISAWPGFDQIAQGYSGLMSLTGFPDGEPTRTGTAIGDLSAGMWATLAIVSALYERERTGKGSRVTTSLLESLISLLSVHGQRYLSLEEVPKRTGNAHAVISPYGVFQTADGPLNIAPITTEMWGKLCSVLGLPDLPADLRFVNNENRVRNRDSLKTILEEKLRQKTKRDWTTLFVEAGLPAGPINNLDEVFSDPQVLSTQIVAAVDHPVLGPLRQTLTPMAHAGAKDKEGVDTTFSGRYPPALGEHSLEILREIGYGEREIEEFLRRNVVYVSETKKPGGHA